MIVKREFPPLYAEILAAFPSIKDKPIIFAVGVAIYNPLGGPLTKALLAHESVHGFRQGDDIEGWWRRYIADKAFRLDEEIPAHVAELKVLCHEQPRKARRMAMHHICHRLASPMYGPMVRYEEARRLVKQGMANGSE